MTTLLHLGQSIADMQDHLAREQRFSHEACHGLLTGVKLCREAIDALERDIRNHFEERDRSVARLIGGSQSFNNIIDGVPTLASISGAVGASRETPPHPAGSVGPAGPEITNKTAFTKEDEKREEDCASVK